MLTRRRCRRSGERGQTLVLAIAFIGFFGLVIGAVLSVGGLTGLEHVHTETTASTDSLAEGGAALAGADSARSASDLSLSCAPGDTGQLKMQGTNDVVGYTVNPRGCNPGLSGSGSNGPGPGNNCLLCLLNTSGVPTATILSLKCAQCSSFDVVTTGGDDYINGSIASGSSLEACADPACAGLAHIRVISGASGAPSYNCVCSPTPTKFAPMIVDPYTCSASNPNAVCAPSTVAGQPVGCTSAPLNGTWNAANGCSATVNSAVTINPGLWNSLSIHGSGAVTMTSGLYVFTGTVDGSGDHASVTGTGVTIFLTCPGYGPAGTLCTTAGSGGSINMHGDHSSITTTPPAGGLYRCGDGTTGCGVGLALLADPRLTGPVLTSHSKAGTGESLAGNVDARSGDIDLQAGGALTIGGRLIANSLTMQVTGQIGSGLALNGTLGTSTSTCGVFDVNVTGTPSGGSASNGRAILQSQCSSLSGIVAFNYTP